MSSAVSNDLVLLAQLPTLGDHQGSSPIDGLLATAPMPSDTGRNREASVVLTNVRKPTHQEGKPGATEELA